MLPIILASGSVYRKMQLESVGLNVQSIAANIDESAQDNDTAVGLAIRLSQQKAQTVGAQYSSHWVIGCDQVACVNIDNKDHFLGKPGGFKQAIQQLSLCSGREVQFFSAVSLYQHKTRQMVSDVDTTSVKFRSLSVDDIDQYIRAEQPYDSAGSFKIEGKGIMLFEHVSSTDPSGLVGLPLILLRKLCTEVGIDLLAMCCAAR